MQRLWVQIFHLFYCLCSVVSGVAELNTVHCVIQNTHLTRAVSDSAVKGYFDLNVNFNLILTTIFNLTIKCTNVFILNKQIKVRKRF